MKSPKQEIEELETIEALKPAIAEMKDGQGEAAEKVFAELLEGLSDE